MTLLAAKIFSSWATCQGNQPGQALNPNRTVALGALVDAGEAGDAAVGEPEGGADVGVQLTANIKVMQKAVMYDRSDRRFIRSSSKII